MVPPLFLLVVNDVPSRRKDLMRRTLHFALAAAGVLVFAAPAAAQFRSAQQGSSRPISFAFGGGASVPIGDYKDALKAGQRIVVKR